MLATNKTWYCTLEHSLAVFKSLIFNYIIQQPCSLFFTQKIELMFTQTMQKCICSNFVHNWQNMEAAKMYFSGWLDKLWQQPENRILLSAKKKKTVKLCQNMEKFKFILTSLHITKWKKLIRKFSELPHQLFCCLGKVNPWRLKKEKKVFEKCQGRVQDE